MSKPENSKADSKQPSQIGKLADKAAIGALKVLQAPYEGTLGQWFAHGATELANMALHGHAAPVYSHSLAPSDVVPTADAESKGPAAIAPTTGNEPTAAPQSTSIVDKFLPAASQASQPQVSETMVTSHGKDGPQKTGIVDHYMHELRESPVMSEPEQEISK